VINLVPIPELRQIKAMRKSLGITQKQLAELSNVSQSLIARIESNRVDPSYSKVKKIFEALERIGNMNKNLTAKEIMTKNIISITKNEKITTAAKIMKRKNISQLPVMENNKVIGTISEKDISHAFSINENPKKLLVKDVMTDPLPIINYNATIEIISHLLDFNPATLVMKRGKIIGIVSRADLLKLFKK